MTGPTSENPLFDHDTHPRFEEVLPNHAKAAIPLLLEKAKDDFSAFESTIEPTWNGIFERQRKLIEPLGYAWHITGHLMSVRNSDELRAVYEELQPSVVEFFTALGQSTATYKALETLVASEEWKVIGPTKRRLVEKELLRMQGRALQSFIEMEDENKRIVRMVGNLEANPALKDRYFNN